MLSLRELHRNIRIGQGELKLNKKNKIYNKYSLFVSILNLIL